MPKKVRSAKGEMVDFDLMNIHRQLAQTPVNPDVAARQDFIDRRLRRRLRKVPAPAPKIEDPARNEANLPGTEELSEPQKLIDEVEPVVEEKPVKKTRQKARPKAEPKTETETEE